MMRLLLLPMKKPRWCRRNTRIAITSVVLGMAVLSTGTAWYFSNQIILPVHKSANTHRELVESVRAAEGGREILSLKRTAATARQGTYALFWDGGSALVGPVLTQNSSRVDRELLAGDLPTPGTPVGMSWSYGSNPKDATGLDFVEVSVPTERGPAPAWYVPVDPQASDQVPAGTWVVLVHGSNADRRQFLRYLPQLHQSGLAILDITYRNDIGAPTSPDGLMHLGATEWRDLDAAVRTAKKMGAQRVVLFGGSMGGAVVLQYLAHASDADNISAVLLEAPMLSVPGMMKYIGKEHRIPDALTRLATSVTGARIHEDLSRIDFLRYPPKARPPLLLMQGMNDEIMPYDLARKFVVKEQRDGWPIQYAEFPGADHGGVWNSNPQRAEALVRYFLQQLNWSSESK